MNCKPGDLAVLIRSAIPENVGIIVEVVEWMGHVWSNDSITNWRVRPVGGPRQTTIGSLQQEGAAPDEWLRPVSGLPDTEDTDEREPIKEVA
jgi:hypothetical protein